MRSRLLAFAAMLWLIVIVATFGAWIESFRAPHGFGGLTTSNADWGIWSASGRIVWSRMTPQFRGISYPFKLFAVDADSLPICTNRRMGVGWDRESIWGHTQMVIVVSWWLVF